MTKSKGYSNMNISSWTSSSREIERIIIRNYKDNEVDSEIEIRYSELEVDKYISLLTALIANGNERAYRYSKKNKYICKLIEIDGEITAIIIRLK